MTPEEIQALLIASAPHVRDHAIFRLAYHHGLRASEIGMIQMRDYHPSARKDYDRLVIDRLKGSFGGDTVLVEAAADAIRRWVKKRGVAPGAMFVSRQKGRISRTMLHYLMKHYCKLAGIPEEKAHFHALKHTCGTIMLSVLKESIVDVQHHMGHADIRSTMVYAKLTEQANEERASRLKHWK
jgi:integrase